MPGIVRRVAAALLTLIALTLLLSSAVAARSGAANPAAQSPIATPRSQNYWRASSATDDALRKMSPDLRQSAQAPDDNSRFVFVLVRPGTSLGHLMTRSVTSRPLGEYQWITGEVPAANLVRLASIEGVISVASTETYQPLPAPGLEAIQGSAYASGLSRQEAADILATGGKAALLAKMKAATVLPQATARRAPATESAPRSGDSLKSVDIHRAYEAHEAGYTGQGIIAAVIDSGVDFGHPDLQGTQARIAGGPYDGWPFAYDTMSGANYAIDGFSRGPENYWDRVYDSQYVHTLPVEAAVCDGETCAADLTIDYGELAGHPWPAVTLPFTWPDHSQSGAYYYTVYPVYDHLFSAFLRALGYASSHMAPAAVIVADEATGGVYDTVYVDADFDQDLADEKPMSKGDELSGTDLFNSLFEPTPDGYWDMSVSMLTWIADGENPPPGVAALYNNVTTPQAGRLLAFVNDSEAHGTNVASMIAAQSIITDPDWQSSVNPLWAGGANVGGVGGPVLGGTAPDAHIAAFMNGFNLPYDSWVLAALGFDGAAETGDEAQVVNNSWGDSNTADDGWDATARFVHYLNRNFAPTTTFLAATGNGGPGYGTTTSPNGATIIKVGASTSAGTIDYFELVGPEQFTFGVIQPWSNRGPGALGDIDPDVVCVGAWGLGATPLNRFPNGQAAYDVFGGTSMSSPVCAGVTALVYQAFHEAHDRWPTWQETADILSNGAADLGYDVLAQGAGNADAMRSVSIALGEASYATPAQLMPGDYRGEALAPTFPAIVHPGDTVTVPLTIHNPTDSPQTVELEDVTFQRVHEVTFTVTLGPGNISIDPINQLPDYVQNVTELIEEYDPDLVRAHTTIPFQVFDRGSDYYANNTVRSLFYDWTDLNGDGNLWIDANGNGAVEPDEIDIDKTVLDGFEINRYSSAYGQTNVDAVDIGRRALDQRHDGVYFGLMRSNGAEEIEVTVTLVLYKKADWAWLSLPSNALAVPAGGEATTTVTMAVPADAGVGLYEGAVAYDGQVIPVIVHVAAGSTTFNFGAAATDEPFGDTPYDNGHVFGSVDWAWRPETGDWRQFFYDLPDGAAGPGTAMLVETEWTYPLHVDEIPFPPTVLFEEFEGGIPFDWENINNGGDCVWTITNPEWIPNVTGGEGEAAIADSGTCGWDTTMDTELRTPVIDLSGYDEVWLAFRTDFYGYLDGGVPVDHAIVDVSTNGGDDWTNVMDEQGVITGPAVKIFDLSAFAGEPAVTLRFRYISPGWHAWWQIDEIGLYLGDPTAAFGGAYPDLTDVDTYVFGAGEDDFSTGDPAFFGPSSVDLLNRSENYWLSNGTWAFNTATGGPKEVVGAATREGLGFISLHNVLNAGRVVGEAVAGRAYQLTIDPAPLVAEANEIVSTHPLLVAAEMDVTIESTADIAEGLSVRGFGVSQPIERLNQAIAQDDPNNLCTASWYQGITIADGALIEATMTATNTSLDVDLFLLRDGGDGVFDCMDETLIAASATAGTNEHFRLLSPPDGHYWVLGHGWSVPGGSGQFDLTIDVIQGHDLVVDGLSAGPVVPGEPVNVAVTATVPHEPGAEWKGLLFVGPANAPSALIVPVTITTPEADTGELITRFSAAPDALATGDTTTVSLWVWNHGASGEAVEAVIDVPAGLVVDPGSIQATVGQATFNVAGRTITWAGSLAGGEHVTITFAATASTRSGRVAIEARVNGLSRPTEANLTIPVWLNMAAPDRVILLPAMISD